MNVLLLFVGIVAVSNTSNLEPERTFADRVAAAHAKELGNLLQRAVGRKVAVVVAENQRFTITTKNLSKDQDSFVKKIAKLALGASSNVHYD